MGKPAKREGPWPKMQHFWDVRAACNFIGGGAGTALLLLAAVSGSTGMAYLHLAVAGLVLIAFGLFMVFLELGRPWRSINVFFHPKTSWMTRESILAIPIFGAGFLAILYHGRPTGLAAIWVAGVLGIGYSYCQARMIHASKGIPAWSHQTLIPFLMLAGPAEGTGLAAAFYARPLLPGLAVLLAVLVLLRAVAWRRYVNALNAEGAPEATRSVLNGLNPPMLLAGHLLPLVLIVIAWFGTGSEVLLALAGIVTALASWYAKVVILTRAAQTTGFAIPRSPVRGRGPSKELGRPGW